MVGPARRIIGNCYWYVYRMPWVIKIPGCCGLPLSGKQWETCGIPGGTAPNPNVGNILVESYGSSTAPTWLIAAAY